VSRFSKRFFYSLVNFNKAPFAIERVKQISNTLEDRLDLLVGFTQCFQRLVAFADLRRLDAVRRKSARPIVGPSARNAFSRRHARV